MPSDFRHLRFKRMFDAARDHNRQVRSQMCNFACQFQAAHLRHVKVRQQHVEASRIGAKQLQRLRRIGGAVT